MAGQTKASIILSSRSKSALSSQLASTVVTVDARSIAQLEDQKSDFLRPNPSSTMYVVFTSGSTGTPKGTIISHQNLSSAIHYQKQQVGLSEKSRVFDFVSYGFDMSVYNVFATLAAGGCLCVPSEEGRRDRLAQSIQSFDADFVILTPSVARLLSVEETPTLRTILFIGEPLYTSGAVIWWERVRILNTYGPAECTPISSINPAPSSPQEAVSIGKGVGNMTWVVDAENHDILLPPGCIGELVLEGPLVGCGYLNEPEKTKTSFLTDPKWLVRGTECHQGRHGQIYKTGDLVQYSPNGALNFVGRRDTQIKISGQRIELGEIEYQIQQLTPDARHVVVEAIEPQGEGSRPLLAAFIKMNAVTAQREQIESNTIEMAPVPAELDAELASVLPSYMIPAVIVLVQELPLTATGKMDRKRLREIGSSFTTRQLVELRTAGENSKRQPTPDTEELMQKIWAQVLNMEQSEIGVYDSFLRLGGNSIAAMKVVGDSRRAGYEIAVSDIFLHPKLHQVATKMKPLTSNSPSSILPHGQDRRVEQSFAQSRLWFSEQLHPGLTWYLMPCAIRLHGPIQLHALDIALAAAEHRHETLRTTLVTEADAVVQNIHPFQHKKLKVVDISEGRLAEALKNDQTTPFNLDTDPGWRVSVYRLDDDNHVLSIVMHHIFSDGWSLDVLRKDLGIFYSAAIRGQDPVQSLEPLPVQYQDYSYWQRMPRQVEEHDLQLEYWVSQLKSSRPAEIFPDKPRPAALSGKADISGLRIEGSLYRSLQTFCNDRQLTPFVVLLAAFRATHFRLTGTTDATIGTPNANRDRWELKDVVGFFVNMQCIRITVEEESFEDLVRQVQSTVIESFAHQDVPFEKVVSKLQKKRDISRNALVQIAFALHSQLDLGKFDFEGVNAELMDLDITTRFDLEFHFYQEKDALQGQVMFSTDLYHAGTIENMLCTFKQVVERVLEQPTVAIGLLPLLNEEAYFKLNKMELLQEPTTDYPRDSSVVEVFRHRLTAYPEKLAVKDSQTTMTYRELDHTSDIIAKYLAKRSMIPESLIGVFADRSCQTIAAFLGVLKANLAYLPLDINAPTARLQKILSAVEAQKLVLVGSDLQFPLERQNDLELVSINDILEDQTLKHGSFQEQFTATSPSPRSLAYVMFTSGSTGQPKGVMVEHQNILRLTTQSNVGQHLPPAGIMAHISNIAFDSSTWEIYATLLNGGTLICMDKMTVLDQERLAETLVKENIQIIFITPALLKQYLNSCPSALSGLEAVFVGGERLDVQDIFTTQSIIKGKVISVYGPTENTGYSTLYCVSDHDPCANGVPIGRTVSNSGAFVMDPQMNLVPLGVIGELVVTGDGIARGYTDAKRNLDRFINVDLLGKSTRAYRTGDFVRYRPVDGQLEFLGRIDGQVKIRGQRVELGEIEHVLRSHRCVDEAASIVHSTEGAEPQLICFVTICEDDINSPSQEDDGKEESHHIEVWEERFDTETYAPMENIQPGSIGRDFIGWTSMFDGSEIDKGEMNEWLDDTIEAILSGGSAGTVLEIGTGSGMILFNLGNGLKEYYGLDPSKRAVEFTKNIAQAIPALSDNVHMFVAIAADITRLKISTPPQLVVVNSVAQYFPSQQYLFNVIEDLIRIGGVKRAFFGDMRSHALYRQFLASRALFMAGETVSKLDIRRMMADMQRVEMELLVDPAFFTSLPSRLPKHVAHVEILPKRMHATNELSCYRYAAVVHFHDHSFTSRKIHTVDETNWIDFRQKGLDADSLSELLRASSDVPVVAVSNIPYKKTIFERHLLECLDKDLQDPTSDKSWLKTVRIEAKKCSSLAAVDLVHIARQQNLQVEISWNRQYSQRGGLDAIFHHYKPQGGQNRTLFHFPTDHQGRVSQSLCSQPLRQQAEQKVKADVLKSLQAQLPPYMVPQVLKIMDKLPVNENGKIDRRLLEGQVDLKTAGRQSTKPPTTEEGKQMQAIWAQVLNIEPSTIGLDDSFFQLGGNSISAMTVVREARKIGITMVVADIFRRDTLGALLQEQESKESVGSYKCEDASILDSATKESLLSEIDTLGIRLNQIMVADILPVTSCQEYFVDEGIELGQMASYFYLDLPSATDIGRLEQNCLLAMQSLPILRACFLHLKGKLWQVTPDKLNHAFTVLRVTGDLDQVYDEFWREDHRLLLPTDPPFSLTVLQHETQGCRFVVRISHAQYDGVCLPIIFQSLMDGPEASNASQGPSFLTFLSYASHRRSQSIDYWTKLLQGSQRTTIREGISPPHCSKLSPAQPIRATAEADMPAALPGKITSATLISAAWAVLLSSLTGAKDVTYGHVVNGRNSALQGVEQIVGPCLNMIPVRAKFTRSQTAMELLSFLQQQFLSIGEADSLGYRDIIDNCTDWPTGSTFDTTVQHQNLDEHPEIQSASGTYRLQFAMNPDIVPRDIAVMCYPLGNNMQFALVANTHIMSPKTASSLLEALCTITRNLIYYKDVSLSSWMGDLEILG